MSDARSFLMGGKVRAAFGEGDVPPKTVVGIITEPPNLQQQRDFNTGEPEFWNNDPNQPKMQLVVTVQTTLNEPNADFPEDDGIRRHYVKGNLQKAVRQAVKDAGADDLQVGGELSVTFTGLGEALLSKSGKKLNPPRLHRASYIKPSGAYLKAGDNGTVTESATAVQQPVYTSQSSAPDPFAGMDDATRAALLALAQQQAKG